MAVEMVKIIDGPTTCESMQIGCSFYVKEMGWLRVSKEEIKRIEHVKNVKKKRNEEGEIIEEEVIQDPMLVEVDGSGTLERGGKRFSFSGMFYDLQTRNGYINKENFVESPPA